MDLDPYVEAVERQLAAAAETGGDEARALAAQLAATLESALRLALQDALASAVNEITCELAPGAVELRLRGREPEFVVVPPTIDPPGRGNPELLPPAISPNADQSAMARINLRLPAQLKIQVEAAASAAGLSVNTWLVRVAVLAAEGARNDTRVERVSRDGRDYRGWAR